MSCVLGSLLGNRDPRTLVPGPGGERLVALRVGDVRSLGLVVAADPIDGEDAHAVLIGPKSRAIHQQLAALSTYVV